MPNVTGGARESFGGSAGAKERGDRAAGKSSGSGGGAKGPFGPGPGFTHGGLGGSQKVGPSKPGGGAGQSSGSSGGPPPGALPYPGVPGVFYDPKTGKLIKSSDQGNTYPGYKGPGGTMNPTADPPGQFGLSGPETRVYDQAKMAYNAPYGGTNPDKRSILDHILDTVSPFGIHNVNPQINQPSSWANGTYHTGLNPAEAAGGIIGSATGIPAVGSILGAGYSALGLHDLVLGGAGGGFSTSYPDGGPGYNGGLGSGTHANAPGRPGSAQGTRPGGFGVSNPMAAFPTQPAPSNSGGGSGGGGGVAAPAPDPMAAFPTASGVPNHTLPANYTSLFPDSLTAQDKALLFGQALSSGGFA